MDNKTFANGTKVKWVDNKAAHYAFVKGKTLTIADLYPDYSDPKYQQYSLRELGGVVYHMDVIPVTMTRKDIKDQLHTANDEADRLADILEMMENNNLKEYDPNIMKYLEAIKVLDSSGDEMTKAIKLKEIIES